MDSEYNSDMLEEGSYQLVFEFPECRISSTGTDF